MPLILTWDKMENNAKQMAVCFLFIILNNKNSRQSFCIVLILKIVRFPCIQKYTYSDRKFKNYQTHTEIECIVKTIVKKLIM